MGAYASRWLLPILMLLSCGCAESAFSSWQGVAHDFIPMLGPVMVTPGLDPAESARSLEAPLLLVHGTADRTVEVEHAYRIARLASEAGVDTSVTLVHRGGHTGLVTGRTADDIQRFFVRNL